MTNVICDNCGWTGDSSECEEVRDAWERVQAGDVMPHGDCPECESGCYEPDRPNPPATVYIVTREACEPDANHPQADFAAWVAAFALNGNSEPDEMAANLEAIESAAREFVKSGTLPDAVNDEKTGHCTRRHFECSECGESWSDDWDCGCNDRCPGCDTETEPHTVEDITPEECNGCPACDREGES